MLPFWVEFFYDLKFVRGRSNNTILAYRRDLELYQEYSQKNKDIKGFYVFMNKRKLSVRSQARVISSLRTYFRFAAKKDSKVDELKELVLPKVNLKMPKIIFMEDFYKLLSSCNNICPYRTYRNKITLFLLFGLGCRVSELINLELSDFNENMQILSIKGKKDKIRTIPLNNILVKNLSFYIKNIRRNLQKNNADKNNLNQNNLNQNNVDKNNADKKNDIDTILINDRGNAPSRIDIWRWLDDWSHKAGFNKTINPHRFRHGFATSLVESGMDLDLVRSLLGHQSIQTTQIYKEFVKSL